MGHDSIPLTRSVDIAPDLLELCLSVTAKRARTVIAHILEHGMITTEDLSSLYGYDHPPRAARDVRELGIPLNTHKIISKTTGRTIGAYTFGDASKIKRGRIDGRKAFSKAFKSELIEAYSSKEAFTGEILDARYLQIDHRIPYEVLGDTVSDSGLSEFMLLDASSQRAKSWSCEHCQNFSELLDPHICRKCFWASPEQYEHIAMQQSRRVDLIWSGNEIPEYDKVAEAAEKYSMNTGDFIKKLLRNSM